MSLALLLELVGDASAVEVGGWNLRPLVDAVEHGEGHAAVHVRLHVAVEQEGSGSLDVVAERDPAGVALGGRRSEAITVCGSFVSLCSGSSMGISKTYMVRLGG
jgi:hypothetical protein